MNKVFRKCDKCGHEDRNDRFTYLGDSVWSCKMCYSKYTHISRIEEPVCDKQEANR